MGVIFRSPRVLSCVVIALMMFVTQNQSNAAKMVDVAFHVEEILARNEELREQENGDKYFLQKLLGFSGSHKLKELETIQLGPETAKVKFLQTYRGLVVFDSSIVATKNLTNEKYSKNINGKILTDFDENIVQTKRTVTFGAAMQIAKRISGDVTDDVTIDHKRINLVIYLDRTDKARSCYIVRYFVYPNNLKNSSHRITPARPFTIIDAATSEVIVTFDALNMAKLAGTGGNPKIGYHKYGVDAEFLEGRNESDGSCILENNFVKVVDLIGNGLGSEETQTGHCQSDSEYEYGADGVENAANDALFYGTKVANMYHTWYDIIAKHPITLRVNYGENVAGAFWDGKGVTFGSGNEDFYSFVSLDVVSHEMAHGFTEMHSGLLNLGQSAAVNEAFSDIAGEAAKFYVHGTNDWKFGYDITKDQDAIRYLDDPKVDGISIDDVKDYRPHIDAHRACGIFNKAFYLLASTTDWGIQKAFNTFVLANRLYWRPQSDFVDAACGVIRAAADLEYHLPDVEFAFYQVGLDSCSDYTGIQAVSDVTPITGTTATQGDILKYKIDPPVISNSFECVLTSMGQGRVQVYGRSGFVPNEKFHDFSAEVNINEGTFKVKLLEIAMYYLIFEALTDLAQFDLTCSFGLVTELAIDSKTSGLGTISRPLYFMINSPAEDNGKQMTISTFGPIGDADLVASYNTLPTLSVHGYRSMRFRSNETVNIRGLRTGKYYVMVYPSHGFFDLTISVEVKDAVEFMVDSDNSTEVPEILPGVAEENLAVKDKDKKLYFMFRIPKGTILLEFFLSQGEGDPDMYIRHNIIPTMTLYDYRPWITGSFEIARVQNPAAGAWYIMINGWTEFSGVRLMVKCFPIITKVKPKRPVDTDSIGEHVHGTNKEKTEEKNDANEGRNAKIKRLIADINGGTKREVVAVMDQEDQHGREPVRKTRRKRQFLHVLDEEHLDLYNPMTLTKYRLAQSKRNE